MLARLPAKPVMINLFKATFITLILLTFSSASYFLVSRLAAQVYFLKAKKEINKQSHETAIALLHQALKCQSNKLLIYKSLGYAYYLLARKKSLKEAFETALKSKDAYMRAYKLAPIDAEIVWGLASAENRLEELSLYFNKTQHSYNAMPYYQELIHLSPNLVDPLKAFINYLYWKNKINLLTETVTNLIRVYPAAYGGLKKQPYWSPEVRLAAKKGIQQAIAQKISPSHAHGAMQSILVEQKDWKGAIYHYKKFWLYRKHTHPTLYDGTRYHLELGHLYMEKGEFLEAEKQFFNALLFSKSIEKTLESINNTYKKKNALEQFLQFLKKMKDMPALSTHIIFRAVKSLIDLEKYGEAKKLLEERNRQEPDAVAYFWLAKIAEKENDIHAAEAAIHKASLSEPTNSQYYAFYSRILVQQKRLSEAEKKIDLAIQFSINPQAVLFHNRALIRLKRNNYAGAANDWKSAINIEPENHRFLMYAADALQQMGDISLAITYIEKAVKLNPTSKTYRKKLESAKGAYRK